MRRFFKKKIRHPHRPAVFVFASCRSHDLESPHAFPADEPKIQPPFQKIIEFSPARNSKRETPAPQLFARFFGHVPATQPHTTPGASRPAHSTRGRADQRPRQPAGARPPTRRARGDRCGSAARRRQASPLSMLCLNKKRAFFFSPGGWIAYQFGCAAPHFRPQFLPNNSE